MLREEVRGQAEWVGLCLVWEGGVLILVIATSCCLSVFAEREGVFVFVFVPGEDAVG